MKSQCIPPLVSAGITREHANALRRIALVLQRWHEGARGLDDGASSYVIVRGRMEGKLFHYDDDGAPFIERHHHHGPVKPTYERVADRERGALKRLKAIMARYPGFASYVQTDPCGAPLYILRPGDLPEGGDPGAYYNRGLAVYR
jgi:hypothetical protein